MADIFISYAREDQEKAGQLALALEAKGWTVFWDRTIPPGKSWRDYIGAKLKAARCVIVAWSKTSVQSEWVLEEADEGKNRKILVPVLFDKIQIPLGFRSIQTANLSNWKGETDSIDFSHFVDAVSGVIGAPVEEIGDLERPQSNWFEHKSTILLVVGTLALIVVGGLFNWKQIDVQEQQTELPPVAQQQREEETRNLGKGTNNQVRMDNPSNQINECIKQDPPLKCLFR